MRATPRQSWIRLTSVLLVALLCLASARSLAPGICATQAALDAASASCVTTCCDRPSPSGDGERPVAGADGTVSCALCKLATILVDTPRVVTVDRVAACTDPIQLPFQSLALVEAIDQTHAGRAPPATIPA